MKFAEKGTLLSHYRRHTGTCLLKFNNLTTTSTMFLFPITISCIPGEKPFECDQCHIRFSVKNNLSRHLRTHQGLLLAVIYYFICFYILFTKFLDEKTFACEKCSKKFSQKRHLSSHYRRHAGSRFFHRYSPGV